ncbi:MAG TPA: SdrD B-like domain-containing protein [Candidatus Krumholzibacteria bacterium]|nr:SdrD B-like domain-containing protein [Candidatus Krumholzibacteria bacterium]
MAFLNRIRGWVGLFAVASVAFAGCSADRTDVSSPVGNESPVVHAPLASFVSQETTINNFVVRFDGRTVSGGNTTFTYTVRGTGVDPNLSHFTVELPACAPAPLSFSPAGSANVNTNPQSGIYGVEWHLSVSKDNLAGQTYSITFPGEVALGIVRSEVKTENGARGVGSVFGPCSGFRISGTVFVDADNNGLLSATEAGIEGVTVTVSDGAATQSSLTDAAGGYTFVVTSGTYTVSIEASTAAADLNEDLFATATATTPTSRTVTTGPDAPNTNFAFEPASGEVVDDLKTGVLLTAGKPVRFWKTQLRNAQMGKASTYSAAQLLAWLGQIEGLGIADPFQFGTGNEINEAFAILSDNTRNDIVALKRELLASELNLVSGNGLVGQEDLHEVLIIWGEELVAQASAPAGPIAPAAIKEFSEAQSATGMFGLMNGSTGGGGTDE